MCAIDTKGWRETLIEGASPYIGGFDIGHLTYVQECE